MATVIIRPISTYTGVSYQHWSNSREPIGTTDANTYTLVDEAVSDEDTSYFQTATSTHAFEHFGMGDPEISSGVITNVRVYFRCRYGTATDGYSRAIFGGVGGVVGDIKTSTGSYQTFTQDWAINPITSSAWVAGDFYGGSSYKFGVEGWGSGTKSNNRCTQFYVEITYTAPKTIIQGLVIQGCIIS